MRSVSLMCPSSWLLGTNRKCTEHSDAHRTHPIPSMTLTASQVQLIPTPAQTHWHIPQPHMKIPLQGSHISALQPS